MKNTLRIALVVAVFTAAKLIYYFATRVTQDEVIAYVNAIDAQVVSIDKEVSSAALDLSFSSSGNEGEEKLKALSARIKEGKEKIAIVKMPRDDNDFNRLKESALAQLTSDSANLSGEMTTIVLKLLPQKEAPELDQVAMMFQGGIIFKKSPLNDSLDKVISGLRDDFETKQRDGMSKYNAAKQDLYSKYKIIELPTFR